MPQVDQLSACPGCGEPLAATDRACASCGEERRPAAADGPAPADGAAPSGAPAEDTTAGDPSSAADGAAPDTAPTPTGPDSGAGDTAPGTAPDAPAAPDSPATPENTATPDTPAAPTGTAGDGAPVETDPAAASATVPATERDAGAPDPRRPDAALPMPEAPAATCVICGTGAVDEDGYCTDCGRAQPGDRDHVERSLGGVGCVTDLGKRHHRNEDAFSISATALPDGAPAVIAVVCDGVSSSSRPHEASAAAADAAGESLLAALPRGLSGSQAMREALLTAGQAVNALADGEQEPGRNAPACTVVSAVTTGSELTVGWVGDSRAYWLPMEGDAHPIRLTEDDSWAAQMVKAGLLSEEEAMADRRAHAITAWLGADNPELDPHTASFKPDKPGVVVICTDGLWNYADAAEELAARLPATARSAPLDSARDLVRYALDSGGHDNVTVAVLPFPTPGLRAARTTTGRAAELPAPARTDTMPAVPRPHG